MVVLSRFFFHMGCKKVVADHVRQAVVLYRNDCVGIGLGGLNNVCLRRMVRA